MRTPSGDGTWVLPVVQEELDVETLQHVRHIRVNKTVSERDEAVDVPLTHEEVRVERVPVNRVVVSPEPARLEGNTTVIPIYEEIVVVEKRLVLKEELRITKVSTTSHATQTVPLRAEHVAITESSPETRTRTPEGSKP